MSDDINQDPESTFILLKPDAMVHNHGPAILNRFRDAGLEVPVSYQTTMTPAMVATHYQEKFREMPQLAETLLQQMMIGPVLAAIVRGRDHEGVGAMRSVRKMMGQDERGKGIWNPNLSPPDSIRGQYKEYDFVEGGPVYNVIHGSGNVEDYAYESRLWFDEFIRGIIDASQLPTLPNPHRFFHTVHTAKYEMENTVRKLKGETPVFEPWVPEWAPDKEVDTTLLLFHPATYQPGNSLNEEVMGELHEQGLRLLAAYRSVPDSSALGATYADPNQQSGCEHLLDRPVSVLAVAGMEASKVVPEVVEDLTGCSPQDPRSPIYASANRNIAAEDLKTWFTDYLPSHYGMMRQIALEKRE